jgi:Methyltransferase domain/Glycosyl transferase family 2
METIRNIFACLVHESRDCVVDLVRNLHALDPASLILLYNGGRDPSFLSDQLPYERHGVVLHPSPRPAEWGYLHQFALDCMQWACNNHPFDTLTIVDSDQLALRPGYSDYLCGYMKTMSRVGVLGNSSAIQLPGTRIGPAEAALRERELWRPFLRMFQDGEQKFVHWCFWPSTVFTADAARALIDVFATNLQLKEIMRYTRIWASEEVILPTLVALLGYEIAINPCSYDYVQYRVAFTVRHIEAALGRDDVFWVHPVPRRYDDPLRRRIREEWGYYESTQSSVSSRQHATEKIDPPRLLRTSMLERMRGIEGWLDDAEAELLLTATARAIATTQNGAVVEIGSYCGKSTVVLGTALSASGNTNERKIYAIDPHDGIVGALDQGVQRMPPTGDKFQKNVANAGIAHLVEPITQRAFEVDWDTPIVFLLIDGLHDYFNVSRDFHHFEKWIVPGGLIAFHDYANYYPGVKTFVNELLTRGDYEKLHQALSLIVIRANREVTDAALRSGAAATAGMAGRSDHTVLEAQLPAPSLILGAPLVSCIMPTADRRSFVPQAIRYFQRQTYPHRELVILDDGRQELADLIPSDSRVRYARMDHKSTMGAKHNLACELARGEVIVHWDDDDWMADWRVSYQVEILLAHSVNTLCGLKRLYFYDPATERAWEYNYSADERPWVAGGTFCYRREFWQAHRFPDMNEGADTVFVWGLRDAEIFAHVRHDFYVGVVHAANTSPKRVYDPAWRPVAVQTMHDLLEADRPFYRGLALTGSTLR